MPSQSRTYLSMVFLEEIVIRYRLLTQLGNTLYKKGAVVEPSVSFGSPVRAT